MKRDTSRSLWPHLSRLWRSPPNPPDYTITAANDAYFAATETTSEILVGRRLFDACPDDPSRPGLHGSDALEKSLAKETATRQTDAMERVRYDLVVPGGYEPHWWLAINAPMLDTAGNIVAIIHQVTKETELHLAEEAEGERQSRQALLLRLSDMLRGVTSPIYIQHVAMKLLAEHLGLSRAFYFVV